MRKLITVVLFVVFGAFLALAADPTADLKKADQDWAQAAGSKNFDSLAGMKSCGFRLGPIGMMFCADAPHRENQCASAGIHGVEFPPICLPTFCGIPVGFWSLPSPQRLRRKPLFSSLWRRNQSQALQ